MACGADTEANELLVSLIGDKSFNIPVIDLNDPKYDIPGDTSGPLYQAVTRLTNDDLTTGDINGDGTFDAFMRGFKAHLREELDKNRITGAEYTKAYIELTQAAMANSVQYLINRDQAFWQAIIAQAQGISARVQLQTARVQLAQVQYEALNAEATYGLTKIKISNESMAYCTAKYNLEELLPLQKQLVTEQIETQRSQTMDTRTDGTTPVTGSVGKQKALYDQQITSYKRDAEVKVAKMFADAWITQKTIDEGLLPPDQFNNANINEVFSHLRTNNEID